MLNFVIGLPGRLAMWCDAVVSRLALGAPAIGPAITADTLADMAAIAVRTGTSHGAVACRRPEGRLRAVLGESGRRFVVALDDPRLALADIAGAEPMEAAAAIPAIASSCGMLVPYVAAEGALILRGGEAAADPVGAAERISAHLGFAGGPEEAAGIVAALAAEGIALDPAAAQARWEAIAADERGWAAGALDGYASYFQGGAMTPLSWARELFFLGDRPDERASWIIDITGRARCLLQGPGIAIAPGAWSVGVRLLFSKEATEHEFAVELVSDRQLGAATVRPEREGRLDVDFPLTVDEQANLPLTIRLSSQRAAFDGACAMDLTVLTPQPVGN